MWVKLYAPPRRTLPQVKAIERGEAEPPPLAFHGDEEAEEGEEGEEDEEDEGERFF